MLDTMVQDFLGSRSYHISLSMTSLVTLSKHIPQYLSYFCPFALCINVKITVKLSLYTPEVILGEEEAQLQTFFTSALDEGEW
jgi:hypothetical protein